MGMFDDLMPDAPAGPGMFDDLPPPKKNTGFGGDVVTALKQGAQQIPGMVTGLADIPAGAFGMNRPVSRLADAAGEATGFQPSKWAKETENEYSDATKEGKDKINQAWDDPNTNALDVAGAYLSNPRTTAINAVQSVPAMLVGGLAGRAAGIAGGIASAPARAAIGEGAIMAGSAMDQINPETDPQRAAAAALATGVAGGAVGYAGGRLAQRLGITDLDTLATGGTRAGAQAATPMYKRIPAGMVQEGLVEEAPQSALETASQNWAEGKPLTQGMARNVTEGALAGGLMGGIGGALPKNVQAKPAADVPQVESDSALPADKPLQIGNTPDPMIGFADGTVGRQSEVDKYINGLPPDQQPAARAKLMGLAPQPAKPSESMGLTPTAAPSLTNAAILAVDSGVSQPQIEAADPVQAAQDDYRTQTAALLQQQDEQAYEAYMTAIEQSKVAQDEAPGETLAAVTPIANVLADYDHLSDDEFFAALGATPEETQDAIANQPSSPQASAANPIVTAPDVAASAGEGTPAVDAKQANLARIQAANRPQPTTLGTQTNAVAGPGFGVSDVVQKQPPAQAAQGPVATDGVATERAPFMRPEDVMRNSIASAAQELAMQIHSNSEESDFDPKEVPAAIAQWAKDANVPADELRAAVKSEIEKRTFRRKAGVLQAINPLSQPNNTPTAPTGAPLGVTSTPAAEASPAASDIKAIVAKKIPDMSDDELQQAIAHYGPEHPRTAKLTKAANVRALAAKIQAKPKEPTLEKAPEAIKATPEQPTDQNALVKVKDIDGHNRYVKQGDLDGSQPVIRMFTKDGHNNGRIHRENLDVTGEKLAAANAENAKNQLFDVITNRSGGTFATKAVAIREISVRAIGATHQAVPAETVQPGLKGFLITKKQQAAPAAGVEKAKPTVDEVARAIQLKVAQNRLKARQKSRKEREAKGYAPNSTPDSEQTDYDAEINAEPSEFGKRYAAALLGDSPLPLIEMFVHGNFEASEDVFKDITGVRIRGLSAADKKAALYKWANWTPEQIAKAESDSKERSDRAAEKNKQEDAKTRVMGEWIALDRLQIGQPGDKGVTGQEFVLQAVKNGYNKAHSQKKGIATVYGLTNGEEFTTLKKGALTDFVKAAIAFGGLDKTLEYVNPPKPQAPAGFKDRSVNIGKAENDDGMVAKAFARPAESASNEVKRFYVTMIRGSQVARLAGPFDTKEQAEAMVGRAREEANKADPRSAFDAFGVSGVTEKEPKPGVLNKQLGIGAANDQKPAQATYTQADADAARKGALQQIESAIDGMKGGVVQTKAAKAEQPAQPAAQEPAKPAKIEDSGEVLEGARKLYAKSYAAKMDEGMGMDTAAVPLSKSWPEPDYQRLLDEGADPWAVAMAHAMRDEIPTKPSTAWKVKGWTGKVEILRGMAADAISGKLTRDRISTKAETHGLHGWLHKIDLYQAVGHAKSLKGITFGLHEYGMYGGQTFSPAKKLWVINVPSASGSTWKNGNWGNDLVVADTKEEAIEKFKAWHAAQGEAAPVEAKATSFDIYSYRSKPNVFIIGKRISATKSIDLKEFPTAKEAREYKAANQAELERLLSDAKFEPSERREENSPRVGVDHRNGADVTSEQFRDTFGFRGEQFGASMPQAERQANMNQAYDALMDLAGVIGVPPKALSLNGELGLAFGARGTGGKNAAAAHYERDTTGEVTPNRVVINLTRKNGAGSLAHEWFHAVDNYFARMRGEKGGMLTEKPYERGEGVRPEMLAAFKQLMATINLSGIKERSKQLDKKRVKDYWSTGLEMAARSFESYVIAKLQDKDGANDYLANIVPEELYAMQANYPYPVMGEMPAIRAAFDDFFKTVQTKETDKGVAMFSRGTIPAGLPIRQVTSIVRAITERWGNAPQIIVATNMADPQIPQAVRDYDQKQKSLGATGEPEGFVYGGKVYLLAEQLATPTDVMRVLFHEALGHAGLRGVFGKELHNILNQIVTMRRADVIKKARQYGLVRTDANGDPVVDVETATDKEVFAAMDQDHKLHAAEEVLAEMAQTQPNIGFVTRAIAAIRAFLRKNVPGFEGMKLTDADIVAQFILPARRFVEGKGGPNGGMKTQRSVTSASQMAFERGTSAKDQTDTAAFKAWFGDSKVVDKDGKPLVVYHGTPNNFTEFDIGRETENFSALGKYTTRRSAAFFSADKKFSNGFAKTGGKMLQVYLSIKNPIDLTDGYLNDFYKKHKDMLRENNLLSMRPEEMWEMFDDGFPGSEEFIAALKADGYDGAKIVERSDDGELVDVYAAFNPTQIKSATGNNGDFDGTNPDIRFSQGLGDTLASAANNVRNVKLPADYVVGDFFNSAPGKLGWWFKTVGTQYHLAQKSPAFKRVFDAVQTFLNDVSFYATEAADLAPNILPKLETWKDIGKSPVSAADTKAFSAPVFEGTLNWGRDESGKAVKMTVLEDAAKKLTIDQKAQRLLRNDHISEQVLKMWRGLPIDQYEAMIESKFERDMLKAGTVFTDAELKQHFNLTPNQIKLYREFRKATDKSLTNLAIADMLRFGGKDVEPIRDVVLESKTAEQAANTLSKYLLSLADLEPERVDVLTDTANKMIDKGNKATDLIDRGYAPLSRFGQYTLDVVDKNGERVYFGMFESKWEAARMNRNMQTEYPGATITQGTVSEEAYKMFAGVSPETLELFGDMLGLEGQGDTASAKAFQEYLKLSKSNRSAMKRLIQRKGIAGFNEDAGRVLAGFVYSNARQTSTSLHMGEMTNAANEMPKQQGELKDAAVKLVDYIKNPQEEAQAIRGLMFTQFIGGSIASAMVNLTQPITMTLPWLSQYGGAGSAAKTMTAAIKDAYKKTTGDTKLDKALKLAEEKGIVSPQEVHQLQQQAQGRAALRSGDGTKLGDAAATAQNSLSRFMLAWGKPFSWAEQMNRRVTFIAAYRTAQAQGMADPMAFAEKAINETQGIYNKGNKPIYGRGAMGGMLMTFKQFSISYVEMLQRMYKSGPEGKKAALLALGVLFLMSGASGLPGSDDLDDLISGTLQSMGYNFDSKQKRKEFFVSIMGEDGARFMERGISGLPGVPIDVAGRLGLGNLIPGTGFFVKKPDHTRDAAELFGPVGSFIKQLYDAGGKAISGEILGARGAVAALSPLAAKNLFQSAEMAATDMYKDAKGNKVISTDLQDALVKSLGFQPNDVARSQDASFDVQRMKGLNIMRETEIADKWAKGIFEKDPDKVTEAREELARWNENNPESPIRINFRQIRSRVHNMNLTKAERIAKTAPKEIREAVKRELAIQ